MSPSFEINSMEELFQSSFSSTLCLILFFCLQDRNIPMESKASKNVAVSHNIIVISSKQKEWWFQSLKTTLTFIMGQINPQQLKKARDY